ncbi:YkgJ family cysteine cluster protein [Hahella sp. CR1]|uniref:YkgJ family cysteine cluster protein n=1 Tax=Hahella sp. CR1 TaxID=2992807 RepID=UPI0024422600|nr:YkgJ family cysteine cluster protein [Hahella sp. CR1]MDG9667165.1 YkgJ family cysteine cluster protein [Hahella sp. CR1]
MDSKKIIGKYKKSASEKLRGTATSLALIYNIKKFHSATDELASARLKNRSLPSFECAKGCAYCCSLRVEILPPEAFRIARYIKGIEPEARDDLQKRIEAGAQYAEGKTFKEYSRPCPFLSESGTCEIYSERPHKCRKYFSVKVSACRENNSALEDRELVDAENDLVRAFIELYKKKKVVMHPAELSNAVLLALNDPSLEERWGKGEQVFDLLPEKIEL